MTLEYLKLCNINRIFNREFQKQEIVYSFLVLLNKTSYSIVLNGDITFSYRIMCTCNRSITESLVSRAHCKIQYYS